VKGRWIAPLVVLALAACAAPASYGGAIPIDHEGLAARLRVACGLGKTAAAGGTCTAAESAPPESEGADEEGADETEETDIPRDADTDAD
jgi:hypothetical protein